MKDHMWLCTRCFTGGLADTPETAAQLAKDHLLGTHVDMRVELSRAVTGPVTQSFRIEQPPVIVEAP